MASVDSYELRVSAFFSHAKSALNEASGLSVMRAWQKVFLLISPQNSGEIWKSCFYSENAYKFSVYTSRKNLKTEQSAVIWICVCRKLALHDYRNGKLQPLSIYTLSTLNRKLGVFNFVLFSKALFPWLISVDGRPNRRKVWKVHCLLWTKFRLFVKKRRNN